MDAFLHFGFLQRGLVAGLFIAAACAVLGVFLVLRKDAMVGHGLAHIAFAGVALGLVLRQLPILAALAVAVVAALGVMKLKDKAAVHGDTAIGIVSSVGLAAGVLLASISGSFSVELLSYLFGDILAIEPLEVWLSLGLAALVLAALVWNYDPLLYMTFDREAARAAGVPVGRLDSLLAVLTAVTVVLGMKVSGLLLVAGLIVIPAAAGLQVARSFLSALVLATSAAVVSVVAGLVIALLADVPASASIVLVAFVLFLATMLLRRSKRRSVFRL